MSVLLPGLLLEILYEQATESTFSYFRFNKFVLLLAVVILCLSSKHLKCTANISETSPETGDTEVTLRDHFIQKLSK